MVQTSFIFNILIIDIYFEQPLDAQRRVPLHYFSMHTRRMALAIAILCLLAARPSCARPTTDDMGTTGAAERKVFLKNIRKNVFRCGAAPFVRCPAGIGSQSEASAAGQYVAEAAIRTCTSCCSC